MDDKNFKSAYVALVGPANAGKSTLLNQLIGKKVGITSRKAHSTRNKLLGIRNDKDSQIIFVDTPGFVRSKDKKSQLLEFLQFETEEAIDDVDIVILVIDANKYDFSILEQFKNLSKASDLSLAFPDIIVLNKIDLIEKDDLLPIISALSNLYEELETKKEPIVVPISAKKNDGVSLLLSEIKNKMENGPAYFPVEMLSDKTDDFFVKEIIREKLFERLNKELPYSIAVEVTEMRLEAPVLRIKAEIVVERESQKGIVIGKKGEVLKQVGTSARIELERAFQTKIFLELQVKVYKSWSSNTKALEKFGYS